MGFRYDLTFDGGVVAGGVFVFEGWIDDAWECKGAVSKAGTPIARASCSGAPHNITLTGPGIPESRGAIRVGERIHSGTILGTYLAEGEDIPYGRSTCTIVGS